MKYYSIKHSYHPKIVGRGNSSHSEEAKYHTDNDNPLLIDKYHLQK